MLALLHTAPRWTHALSTVFEWCLVDRITGTTMRRNDFLFFHFQNPYTPKLIPEQPTWLLTAVAEVSPDHQLSKHFNNTIKSPIRKTLVKLVLGAMSYKSKVSFSIAPVSFLGNQSARRLIFSM